MLTLAEIGPALYGAWRLAHLDPDGMRYFGSSVTGFWRSFRVAVLAAPLWIIILAVSLAPLPATGGWFRLVVAQTIGYVIQWVAFPLAAFYLTTEWLELHYVFELLPWVEGLLGGALLVAVGGWLATRSVIDQPPLTTLRA